ncbi:MAG TPA: DJ-1/PfpI family protein [Candidatus Kryptonia bacterium]|nr:DJ-1/PfpI family protein [Candidatus Kryptonia bacterium]
MSRTIGIVLFDDAEELDWAGPWEVFTATASVYPGDRVVTIAQESHPIRCAKGLRVLPDHAFADAPPLDVVLVPGGVGTLREVENPAMLSWLREAAGRCQWITSVCTGAHVLWAAGLARGKRVTTHWTFIETLREKTDATVLENTRYVRDGNVVTSAGVSAGIDMALWLVGQMYGVETARLIQKGIEYNPAPPYAAEV